MLCEAPYLRAWSVPHPAQCTLHLPRCQPYIKMADNRRRSPPPPLDTPPDQSEHSGKKRNLQSGKSDWVFFGPQTLGPGSPLLSSNVSLPGAPHLPWCTSHTLTASPKTAKEGGKMVLYDHQHRLDSRKLMCGESMAAVLDQ